MRTMLDGRVTTADQLLTVDEPGFRHELVRGELRRMSNAGWWHGAVAMRIGARLQTHVEAHGIGCVFAAETGFLLARDPDTVRSPDAAFVRGERLPAQPGRGYFAGAPDLAVEVTSPSDTWQHVLEKVHDWLAHGARAVWIVEAEARRVSVFDAAGTATVLRAHDTLRGGDVLPDFAIAVADLYPAIG
jgi:Uma2 family endonuclease